MAILAADTNVIGGARHSKDVTQGQFRLPAENATQSHTLMAFPTIISTDGVDEEYIRGLQAEVTRLANAISEFEPVHLYVREELLEQAKPMVKSNVVLKTGPVDQLWIRDSGPVYINDVVNKTRAAVSFNFNYWGNKMPLTGDENLAFHIAEQESQAFVRSRLTMEGGAIEHDGEGTFMGTESSIINQNRNPGMSKIEVEAELRNLFGVTKFVWIPGLRGYDITDYHIDALARFVKPGVVVLSKPAPNSREIVIRAYEEARAAILNGVDAHGRSLTLYECDEPDLTKFGAPDEFNEVVATYVNYLLVNGAVIIPKFGQDEQDQRALELFQELFPSRKVVQALLHMLPRTGGGIHCATQHVPSI